LEDCVTIGSKLLWTTTLVIAVIALAACGGGSDDLGVGASAPRASEVAANANATRADVEACSLLTEEEAAELLGLAVTSVEPVVIRVFRACEWVNDDGRPVQALQVGIFDFGVDSDRFRETAGATATTELDDIPGIADEAAWTGGQLYIRSGSLMLSIVPNRDGGREQPIAAAALVVPRLK
jgi:hypothetical protein